MIEIDHIAPQDRAILTINLDALIQNYTLLKKQASPAKIACVVKADAYGLGLKQVVKRLLQENCQIFFVAQAIEGATLRALSPDCAIYILNGLTPDTAEWLTKYQLRPCLGSIEEIDEWQRFCKIKAYPFPAALHIDTGFNRLGLPLSHLNQLDETFSPILLMSHLACADEMHHPMNKKQLKLFKQARLQFPSVNASFANTNAAFFGTEYHFDIVRIGIGLYGSLGHLNHSIKLNPVVTLEAPILQLRNLHIGDSVGYGATFIARKPSRIAVVALGYGDGYSRHITSLNPNHSIAWIDTYEVPIIGQISMDLIAVDVTEVPSYTLLRGTKVEFIGTHISVDERAQQGGTISYEILTQLGRRYQKHYKTTRIG